MLLDLVVGSQVKVFDLVRALQIKRIWFDPFWMAPLCRKGGS